MLAIPLPSLMQEKESVPPSTEVQAVLGGCLELCEVFVLSGLLRLTPVETRMKMDSGGALRQALRIGECTHTVLEITHCRSLTGRLIRMTMHSYVYDQAQMKFDRTVNKTNTAHDSGLTYIVMEMVIIKQHCTVYILYPHPHPHTHIHTHTHTHTHSDGSS